MSTEIKNSKLGRNLSAWMSLSFYSQVFLRVNNQLSDWGQQAETALVVSNGAPWKGLVTCTSCAQAASHITRWQTPVSGVWRESWTQVNHSLETGGCPEIPPKAFNVGGDAAGAGPPLSSFIQALSLSPSFSSCQGQIVGTWVCFQWNTFHLTKSAISCYQRRFFFFFPDCRPWFVSVSPSGSRFKGD